MTDELKPVRCGCGGEASVEYHGSPFFPWRVRCKKCGVMTDVEEAEAEAVTAWNKAMSGGYELKPTEYTVIRCADCKWWDQLEDGHPYGYCLACKSGTRTERWDISIYRQNRFDFFCADAEPKNEDDDE